jgi:hypothetical protein
LVISSSLSSFISKIFVLCLFWLIRDTRDAQHKAAIYEYTVNSTENLTHGSFLRAVTLHICTINYISSLLLVQAAKQLHQFVRCDSCYADT